MRKKFLKTKNDRPTDEYLDGLWREACYLRDGGECVYHREILHRKNVEILQVHHILQKSTNRLRWDLDNGITVTKGIHFGYFHSKKPVVRDQMEQWALMRLPKKAQERLNMFQNAVGGLDRFALVIYLKQKIEQYKLKRSEV